MLCSSILEENNDIYLSVQSANKWVKKKTNANGSFLYIVTYRMILVLRIAYSENNCPSVGFSMNNINLNEGCQLVHWFHSHLFTGDGGRVEF